MYLHFLKFEGNAELLGDNEDSTGSFHALCMVAQGAGFEKIEDLLSLDTTVLKIIYTSQTEQYQRRFGRKRAETRNKLTYLA